MAKRPPFYARNHQGSPIPGSQPKKRRREVEFWETPGIPAHASTRVLWHHVPAPPWGSFHYDELGIIRGDGGLAVINLTDLKRRSDKWMAWMQHVQAGLATVPAAPDDLEHPERLAFLQHHYRTNTPVVFSVPHQRAQGWTGHELAALHGLVEVEVQAGRTSDPDHEARSRYHKRRMPLREFLFRGRVEPNDYYMTANNTAENGELMRRLAADLSPLPDVLRPDPTLGFLWMGYGVKTMLHHDLTNNLMIQLVGSKRITLFPPDAQPNMMNLTHVYSEYKWINTYQPPQEEAHKDPLELDLLPGQALFIPIGWWHQVKAIGNDLNVTYTSTNFHWDNHTWCIGFP